jgi:hypothetical protein
VERIPTVGAVDVEVGVENNSHIVPLSGI